MNSITTTNNAQPVISLAWDWGFEDGMAGKSEFTGYDYFVQPKLAEYLDGHYTAQVHLKNLKRIAGGSPVNQPRNEVEAMDADLAAIRQGKIEIVRLTDAQLFEIENERF